VRHNRYYVVNKRFCPGWSNALPNALTVYYPHALGPPRTLQPSPRGPDRGRRARPDGAEPDSLHTQILVRRRKAYRSRGPHAHISSSVDPHASSVVIAYTVNSAHRILIWRVWRAPYDANRRARMRSRDRAHGRASWEHRATEPPPPPRRHRRTADGRCTIVCVQAHRHR
jgi:hypothetical protein